MIVLTKHAADKLKTKDAKRFKITQARIRMILRKPSSGTMLSKGVIRAVGELDKKHSLCIVYKFEFDIIKVITFFPAEKGRYED